MHYVARRLATVRGIVRRASAALLPLLALLAASPALAGGLDIFYAQGRANPTPEWPGLDIFTWPPAPVVVSLAGPPAIPAPNAYTSACRTGLWRYPSGDQVSGVACLQPDGTWRMAQ